MGNSGQYLVDFGECTEGAGAPEALREETEAWGIKGSSTY
jgi:hypothetical protein